MSIKTDPSTLKKITALLDGGEQQKYISQTALAKHLFKVCDERGWLVEIERTKYTIPGSPMPTNFYSWRVTDEKDYLVAEFKISRNIWPKSDRSVKGREFSFFVSIVTITKHKVKNV